MANRYYGILPDTPENKRILEITMALDNRRNVTNQPTYLWKVPHLTGNNRIKEGKSFTPMIGAGFAEMDENEPMQRPRGMVSAYTQPPNQFILSGTSASYPYYNADELKAVNAKRGGGWGEVEGYNPDNTKMNRDQKIAYARRTGNMGHFSFDDPIRQQLMMEKMRKMKVPELEGSGALGSMFISGAKTGAKYGAKYGAQAVKTGISVAKTGAQAAVTIAKNPAFQAVVSEIANDKDVQKAVIDQVSSMIKGNKTVADVAEEVTETPVEGGRISRRRGVMRGGMDVRQQHAFETERRLNLLGLSDREQPANPSARASGKVTGRDTKSRADKFKAMLDAEQNNPKIKLAALRRQARQARIEFYNPLDPVKEVDIEGGRIKDGRAKRAEIVKRIMKEKGLKMIEASKYVKANNLY